MQRWMVLTVCKKFDLDTYLNSGQMKSLTRVKFGFWLIEIRFMKVSILSQQRYFSGLNQGSGAETAEVYAIWAQVIRTIMAIP